MFVGNNSYGLSRLRDLMPLETERPILRALPALFECRGDEAIVPSRLSTNPQ